MVVQQRMMQILMKALKYSKHLKKEIDIFVTIREDGISEDDEVFKIKISNFANARRKRGVRQITIGNFFDNFGQKGFFEQG